MNQDECIQFVSDLDGEGMVSLAAEIMGDIPSSSATILEGLVASYQADESNIVHLRMHIIVCLWEKHNR